MTNDDLPFLSDPSDNILPPSFAAPTPTTHPHTHPHAHPNPSLPNPSSALRLFSSSLPHTLLPPPHAPPPAASHHFHVLSKPLHGGPAVVGGGGGGGGGVCGAAPSHGGGVSSVEMRRARPAELGVNPALFAQFAPPPRQRHVMSSTAFPSPLHAHVPATHPPPRMGVAPPPSRPLSQQLPLRPLPHSPALHHRPPAHPFRPISPSSQPQPQPQPPPQQQQQQPQQQPHVSQALSHSQAHTSPSRGVAESSATSQEVQPVISLVEPVTLHRRNHFWSLSVVEAPPTVITRHGRGTGNGGRRTIKSFTALQHARSYAMELYLAKREKGYRMAEEPPVDEEEEEGGEEEEADEREAERRDGGEADEDKTRSGMNAPKEAPEHAENDNERDEADTDARGRGVRKTPRRAAKNRARKRRYEMLSSMAETSPRRPRPTPRVATPPKKDPVHHQPRQTALPPMATTTATTVSSSTSQVPKTPPSGKRRRKGKSPVLNKTAFVVQLMHPPVKPVLPQRRVVMAVVGVSGSFVLHIATYGAVLKICYDSLQEAAVEFRKRFREVVGVSWEERESIAVDGEEQEQVLEKHNDEGKDEKKEKEEAKDEVKEKQEQVQEQEQVKKKGDVGETQEPDAGDKGKPAVTAVKKEERMPANGWKICKTDAEVIKHISVADVEPV